MRFGLSDLKYEEKDLFGKIDSNTDIEAFAKWKKD